MNSLSFISLLSFAVNSIKDHFSNSTLITTAAIALATVSAAYWLKKKKSKEQKKKLRTLKWKLRWALLKSFFSQKKKKNTAYVILFFLLLIGIAVLMAIWLGWLPGLVTFFLLTFFIFKLTEISEYEEGI